MCLSFLIVGLPRVLLFFNRAYLFLVGISAAYFLFLFLFCYYRELVLIKKDLHLGLTMFFFTWDFSDKYNRNPYNRVSSSLHKDLFQVF
jgi:hypothetical protein